MSTLSSRAKSINKEFTERKRARGETNIEWLSSHWRDDRVALLLLGCTGLVDFRLRVAQSHLRNDLTPSHWSHVALMGQGEAKDLATTPVY